MDSTAPPSLEETPDQETLAGPEMQPRRQGRPRKAISEPTIPNHFQHDEARLFEKSRKDLVGARVRFEDDGWLQKLLTQAGDAGPSTGDRPIFY